ncbi:bifunctional 3,4-dihydroxy-2-butanone 4-phosphate synthase/GTP cyclohydrolase II [Helicobacter cholecystus]|uniref:3,4-dihydroxy-2-butanone 4-phosphate synthase n=1 Tax=Helicobacter cholecystus TaxID=45498 RepID=A0A3D8ITW9_9HELI|nr:bifunctional 3,4-dihydroxy-2-butanone 4-phosphate synthase/GTP cyclohydrolase II [Helicobacter cholecystus]RDU68739.1 bifunctional 3,4-dihydroxy-2-butanone 4-phosphate synthase/GTP cyclohydrolase II [Helicobacter cholecystus]VEJ26236.1 3,4-dihydroxy-2-butanone 4-phosphate synthase [Helicobacter cholecystus]
MNRIEEAIEAFKNGEMLIVMDDEDRENEGDLVYAGIFSTPEKVNFMAQEARGLICVSITQELANKLELTPMVTHNDSAHHTAFTVSIDAKEASTGISAYERDMTISLMCDSSSKPSDFVRPGHIFPLVAKEGGVLVRTGHTEASVDLCTLAGLAPVAVICEIMKEDGSMARRGDKFLFDFAKKHNLKTLYVSDIVEYRLKYENLVRLESQSKASFCAIECERYEFIDHLGYSHLVFGFGNGNKTPNIRFHSMSGDVELLSDERGYEILQKSLKRLKSEGGYLVCLHPTHKGEQKSFGIGAQILKVLGVKNFILLSSSLEKEFAGLGGFGVNLVRVEVL